MPYILDRGTDKFGPDVRSAHPTALIARSRAQRRPQSRAQNQVNTSSMSRIIAHLTGIEHHQPVQVITLIMRRHPAIQAHTTDSTTVPNTRMHQHRALAPAPPQPATTSPETIATRSADAPPATGATPSDSPHPATH